MAAFRKKRDGLSQARARAKERPANAKPTWARPARASCAITAACLRSEGRVWLHFEKKHRRFFTARTVPRPRRCKTKNSHAHETPPPKTQHRKPTPSTPTQIEKQTGPDTSKECAKIYGCVECEYVAKPTGTKHRSEGAFLQCLACDLAQGYVLNVFTGRCDCAPGYGAPMASGQLTSLWKYVPEYVDDTWSQVVEDGSTKPILLPDFVWPGKYRHCALCPAGTYTNGAKPIRTRCLFCPSGTTTDGAGCSGSASECCTQCAPGWAWDPSVEVDGVPVGGCVICPKNTWYPGGPASGDTLVECTECDGNPVTGADGFTLQAGSGSEDQCKVPPTCPGLTEPADTCESAPSNYIIRKGFHLEREDADGNEFGVPTTQHYQKKTGEGQEGYYCVPCPDGTTTSDCKNPGGVCEQEYHGSTDPTYKKLRDTKFKRGYHGDFDPDNEEDDLPGVDPIEGYKKVKYSFKEQVDADEFTA